MIELDTPGGLDTSMRAIVQDILASEVPVIVYISPQGARGASAGAIITFAAHVAAMAPGTTIGAATPVSGQAGDDLEAKIVNDAIAYAEALAVLRDRDVGFVADTVRDGRAASASQALELGAIDVVAESVDELLETVDGTTVQDVVSTLIRAVRPGGAVTLVGVPDQMSAGYTIDRAAMFIMTEKTLRGCVYGSSNAHRDIPRYLELWRTGRLDLDRLVTSRRPLADIDLALADLHAAAGIRTVLNI